MVSCPRNAAVNAPRALRWGAVLSHLADGLNSTEVADRLGVEVPEVRRLLLDAIRTLGATSKLEAIVLARQRGLIDPD